MADRRLQVFHAVAKNLSFTKAAEALVGPRENWHRFAR